MLSQAAYGRACDASESAQAALTNCIRERYNEEQLWSDKIRRASTWWTWGLMGLHFSSFLVRTRLCECLLSCVHPYDVCEAQQARSRPIPVLVCSGVMF